jgi:ubiquinone/menaquinone biosynthesis C-methylase UbiE
MQVEQSLPRGARMTSTTQGVEDIRNPFFARLYDKVLQRESSRKDIGCREELLAGLRGRVVEVGPGKGPNFPLYPSTVEEVLAVEPEPYLRERAAETAAQVSVPIRVVAGRAEHIPAEDASVDAVVLALVLCSVVDQQVALTEAKRVLAPGGELRIYEHVVAERPFPRGLQKFAQATFWPRAFGNCHPARDTRQALVDAGFDVGGIRRFVMQVAVVEPPLPYILGRATPNPPPAATA